MGHLILKILNIPLLPGDTNVNQHNTQLQSNVLSMGHVTPMSIFNNKGGGGGVTAENLQGKRNMCIHSLTSKPALYYPVLFLRGMYAKLPSIP